MMWATPTDTVAGSINDKGVFQADQRGARSPVDQVVIRSDATTITAPRLDDYQPGHRDLIRD